MYTNSNVSSWDHLLGFPPTLPRARRSTYWCLRILKVHFEPFYCHGLWVTYRFVACQIQTGSKTAILEIVRQDHARILFYCLVGDFEIVQFAQEILTSFGCETFDNGKI